MALKHPPTHLKSDRAAPWYAVQLFLFFLLFLIVILVSNGAAGAQQTGEMMSPKTFEEKRLGIRCQFPQEWEFKATQFGYHF